MAVEQQGLRGLLNSFSSLMLGIYILSPYSLGLKTALQALGNRCGDKP